MNKLEKNILLQSIRQGLIMLIPILMIGSVALILNFFPFQPYQDLLAKAASGFFIELFTWVNQVTFGIIGIAITINISYSYAKYKTSQNSLIICTMLTAFSTYGILIGLFTDDFNITSLGAQGMFTSIICSIYASVLFLKLMSLDIFTIRYYTLGADSNFNIIVSAIIPSAIVLLIAYLFNFAVINIFDVTSFEKLFHKSINSLFELIENKSVQTLMFVIFTSILWFLGLHGTNVLESVNKNIFYDINGDMITSGIVNKPFMNAFVYMGGCGSTISLLIAVLLFSRQKNNKSLSKMAMFPMIFNINELLIFGFPVIFNVAFLIPFILVPLVSLGIGYFAISVGLVPYAENSIQWVAPIIVGGYQATGSIAGSILQIVNISVGVGIYRWFLVRYEKRTNENIMQDLNSLVSKYKMSEHNNVQLSLLEMEGSEGNIVRMLAEDLKHVIKNHNSLELHYQPQYNNKNVCVGLEALLRWNPPRYGMIYPTLIIGTAKEIGELCTLERIIFTMVCKDIRYLLSQHINPGKVSVNATMVSLQDSSFIDFIKNLIIEYPEIKGRITIELTEQMSFLLGDEVVSNSLSDIRDLGIKFAIDDFSMGHTSVKYLQSNLFDLVKLDGSLTRDMMENPRSKDIISSIVSMSNTMNFEVLAEFVETTEQKNGLEQLGCHIYQGYLFSPAISLDKLLEKLKQEELV